MEIEEEVAILRFAVIVNQIVTQALLVDALRKGPATAEAVERMYATIDAFQMSGVDMRSVERAKEAARRTVDEVGLSLRRSE